jgi:hypothetical protein
VPAVRGCQKSPFYVALESRLPSWFTLPARVQRSDVDVTLAHTPAPTARSSRVFQTYSRRLEICPRVDEARSRHNRLVTATAVLRRVADPQLDCGGRWKCNTLTVATPAMFLVRALLYRGLLHGQRASANISRFPTPIDHLRGKVIDPTLFMRPSRMRIEHTKS